MQHCRFDVRPVTSGRNAAVSDVGDCTVKLASVDANDLAMNRPAWLADADTINADSAITEGLSTSTLATLAWSATSVTSADESVEWPALLCALLLAAFIAQRRLRFLLTRAP